MTFFLIFFMVLGLLVQLWILWILLTVLSYRIARTFSRFSVTRAVALNISKAFDRVLHTGFIQKVKSLKFKVGFLVLFRHFLLINALEKLSQEYPVYDGVPEDCVLGPTKKKSGFWIVAATRVGFWPWILPRKMWQEVAFEFQCWKTHLRIIWCY